MLTAFIELDLMSLKSPKYVRDINFDLQQSTNKDQQPGIYSQV